MDSSARRRQPAGSPRPRSPRTPAGRTPGRSAGSDAWSVGEATGAELQATPPLAVVLELRVHERRRLQPFVDELPNWLITLATARPGRRVVSAGGPRPRPAHAATAWTWRWPFEHGSESLDAAGRSRRGRGQGGQGRRRGPPTARRPTEALTGAGGGPRLFEGSRRCRPRSSSRPAGR